MDHDQHFDHKKWDHDQHFDHKRRIHDQHFDTKRVMKSTTTTSEGTSVKETAKCYWPTSSVKVITDFGSITAVANLGHT